jgi:enolase
MTTIESVDAHWILDSRATPTVEATVTLSDGVSAFAQAPSTGRHESVERRDGDETRFGGKGVESAVDSVRSEISSALRGMDVADQVALDKLLVEIDGTNDRSRLGSNALLAVSAA